MKPNQYVHTPYDGRGTNRDVLLNGNKIDRVIYADEKRGIVRVVSNPIRIDKWHKRVLWKTLRGRVEVVSKVVSEGGKQ